MPDQEEVSQMINLKKTRPKKAEPGGCFRFFLFLVLVIFLISEGEETESKKTSRIVPRSFMSEFKRADEKQQIARLKSTNYAATQERKTGRNLLHLACMANKAELANRLIEMGFEINKQDYNGNTPINLALYHNSPECVSLLMKFRPKLTKANKHGLLPIHSAARYGYFEVVKESLRAGVHVNATAPGHNTPLHYAARSGHLDIVVLLSENGADISLTQGYGWTPGDLAFARHKDVVIYLQSRGAIFSKHQLKREFRLSDGWPFPDAAQIENATSNTYSEQFTAVLNDDAQKLQNLVSRGERLDIKSDSGTPLLSYALIHKKFAAAATIIDNIKSYDETDAASQTALIHAILADNENLALELIRKGADPNRKDISGNVALHYAVKGWHNLLVPALINAGAEVFAQNFLEQGPLHFAVENSNIQIVEFLINNGCDVNLEDIHGDTPLHIATRLGNEQLVSKLIKNGADPSHRNLAGNPPIKLISKDNIKIFKLLRNRIEIEGVNPKERAPAEIDLRLPDVPNPSAEEETTP
jgi:ankyrin